MRKKHYKLALSTFLIGFLYPKMVFAAGKSPEGNLQNVITGITNLFLVLAPSLGGLALIWYGIQHYFAGDSHKKSELRDNMKSTIVISVLIFMESGLVKWIVGLAGH